MEKINVEALNRELPDGYEAVIKYFGDIDFWFGHNYIGAIDYDEGDYWFDMHWSDGVYKTDRMPELISLLKIIQKFMEEAKRGVNQNEKS